MPALLEKPLPEASARGGPPRRGTQALKACAFVAVERHVTHVACTMRRALSAALLVWFVLLWLSVNIFQRHQAGDADDAAGARALSAAIRVPASLFHHLGQTHGVTREVTHAVTRPAPVAGRPRLPTEQTIKSITPVSAEEEAARGQLQRRAAGLCAELRESARRVTALGCRRADTGRCATAFDGATKVFGRLRQLLDFDSNLTLAQCPGGVLVKAGTALAAALMYTTCVPLHLCVSCRIPVSRGTLSVLGCVLHANIARQTSSIFANVHRPCDGGMRIP